MLADQINPIVNVAVVAVVVVGKATVVAPYPFPQVNARAEVVEEATDIINFCPSVGVPVGLLNSKSPACAVTINISCVSEAIDVPVFVV